MNPQLYIKRYIFILIGFLVLLTGFLWWRGHAYIEISVPNASSSSITYYLTNQSNGKTSTKQSSEKTYKKLVRRGSYKVTVWQSDTSYFAIQDVGGFLRTTAVSGDLKPEVSREFAGNNPGQCVDELGNQIISYVCGSLLSSVNVHVAATASQPTYVLKNPNGTTDSAFGYVGGFLTINGVSYVVIKRPSSSDLGGSYVINHVSSNLAVSNPKSLDNLDPNIDYSFTAYKDGFLAYNSDFSVVYYYSSPTASGEKLSIEGSKSKGLEPLSLTVNAGSVAILYGQITNPKSKSKASEVVLWNDGKSTHYVFHKSYTSLTFCSAQKLCLIAIDGLDVYTIDSAAHFAYSIWGVVQVVCNEAGCLAAQRDSVLALNPDGASGYTAYTFGAYRYNALQVSGGDFLLTATGPDNKKVILRLDPSKNDTQTIDQKVGELLKRTDIINTVSAYGPYIYISPNFGDVIYNKSVGEFTYDPTIKKNVTKSVDDLVNSLGIDKNTYTVIY